MNFSLKGNGQVLKSRILDCPLSASRKIFDFAASIAERFAIRGWRTWTALIFVALFVVGQYFFSNSPLRTETVGALSSSHARYGDNCETCHTSTFMDKFASGFGFSPAEVLVSNETCQKCHKKSTIHNPKQIHKTERCTDCHNEHHGAEVIPINDFCVNCHRSLQTTAGESQCFSNVWDFAHHPEFQIHRPSPVDKQLLGHSVWDVADAVSGRWVDHAHLKFNHAVHLIPSGVLTGSENRARKQLQCVDCHKPDPSGRQMLPIEYSQHCQSCHANQLALFVPGDVDLNTKLPHADPEIVRAVMRLRLTDFAARKFGIAEIKAEHQQSKQPFPGLREPPKITREADELVRVLLSDAESRLFREKQDAKALGIGCSYCHEVGHNKDDGVIIVPTHVPKRWLRHSEFNHQAHRLQKCTDCHRSAPTSRDTRDVLLPTVQSCQACHAPQKPSPAVVAHGNCIECHKYHSHNAP